MRRILISLGLAVITVMMIAAFPHIQVDDGRILVTDNKIQFAAAGGAKATGGTITSDETYWYHVFTNDVTSTNFIVTTGSLSCDILVVAGGGGSGASGGGSGGLIYTNMSVSGTNTVIVGSGGAGVTNTYGQPTAPNGEDSLFAALDAIGGGGGASDYSIGSAGGSGGGSNDGHGDQAGGVGTPGQGYDGGVSDGWSSPYPSGGGGGAGAVGGTGTGSTGGAGGVGLDYSTEFGTGVGESGWFAGGGGAGSYLTGTPGTGGNGGGGDASNTAGDNGLANTGGGGGGSGNTKTGGNGGSGFVGVRYEK